MVERKLPEFDKNNPREFLDGRVFVDERGDRLTNFGSEIQAIFFRLDELNTKNDMTPAAKQEFIYGTESLANRCNVPIHDPEVMRDLRSELRRLFRKRSDLSLRANPALQNERGNPNTKEIASSPLANGSSQ